MYQRLKHKRKESCALSPAAVIELETDEVEQSSTSREFKVYGQDILGEDIHIMKSKSKWLNERLMNAGQGMLAKGYPNTAGFYDVGLSDTLAYPDESQSDFIQILNVAGKHWVYPMIKIASLPQLKYTTVDEQAQATFHFQLKRLLLPW